ncbi:MAG: hypothetical protein AAF840_07635 [Bacteroidota bacterium]
MRNFFLLLVLLSSLQLSAQEVISAETQSTTLALVLNTVLPISVQNNVTNYKITYTTTDPFGQPDTATGLLCIPDVNDLVLPLAVYNHGTVGSRDEVPSVEGVLERFIVQGFAASGFIALAPDYLGLGDSDGIHPYLHADTEASAGIDMVIAVKQWLETEGFPQNDQLFVTGYSQGGHASAAFHQRVEENTEDGLEITAAAHLSGAYDITPPSPILLGLTDVDPTALSFFLNTLISYDFVYDLYGVIDSLFVEPYLTEARRFRAEEIDLYEFGLELDTLLQENDALVGEMFSEQFLADVLDADPDLVNAYNDNDVFDWAPQSPTLIYYCNADATVDPANSIMLDSVMRARGATEVLLEDGGPLDHRGCATPAALRALAFFSGFANVFPVSLGAPITRPEVVLTPNPVAAGTAMLLEGLPNRQLPYIIYDLTGRQVSSGQTTINGQVQLPATLTKGWNILRIGLEDGTSVVRRFTIR